LLFLQVFGINLKPLGILSKMEHPAVKAQRKREYDKPGYKQDIHRSVLFAYFISCADKMFLLTQRCNEQAPLHK